MTSSADATIVAIELTVGGRTGVTLWAPPWDEDGEEWQAFLGVGEKLEIFTTTADLAAFAARSGDNDLVGHPAWDMIQTLPPSELEPEDDYTFDLDEVPTLVTGKPDDDTVAEVADIVDMVQRIAECVEDGPLLRMLDGPAFAGLLTDDDPSYDEEDWEELGESLTRAWPLVITRIGAVLNWHDTASEAGADAPSPSGKSFTAAFWDEVGILPVAITIGSGERVGSTGAGTEDDETTGYTLRCYLEDEAIFLGTDGTVEVFRQPADLVAYIRAADAHDLADLDTWSAVRGAAELDVSPARADRYDLRSDSPGARELAADIADYADLLAVTETLDSGKPDWALVRDEVTSTLRWHG